MDSDYPTAQRHLLPLFMDKAWKVGPMPASAFWEVLEIESQGKSMGIFYASTREPREGRDAGIYLKDYCECGAFTVNPHATNLSATKNETKYWNWRS